MSELFKSLVPPFIDELFTTIGAQAIKIVILTSVILAITTGTIIMSMGPQYSERFQTQTRTLFSLNWMIDGFNIIRTHVAQITDDLRNERLPSLFAIGGLIKGLMKVVAGIFSNILAGYSSIAIFIINIVPPFLKPIGIFISTALLFVQFCVYWVVFSYLINLVTRIWSTLTGGLTVFKEIIGLG